MSNRSGEGNGWPRPPKTRTIDLRPGDWVKWHKQWRRIAHVGVCQDRWLTEAEARACAVEGYLYHVMAR